MKISKQISWLKAFVDIWSRAYLSSEESEAHQKNMQNALYDFCDENLLPYKNADELIQYLKVKRLVKYLANDFQLNPKDEGYIGFINTEPCSFDKYQKSMVELVSNWESYVELLKEFNLKFESKPNMEEMILIHDYCVIIKITIEIK